MLSLKHFHDARIILFNYYYYLLDWRQPPPFILPLWLAPVSFLVITMDRVVISPEPFVQKCKSLAKTKNTYLDVLDGRVVLAWMDDGAANFMERADVIGLGLSYDMLLDALSEAGGAIDVNGRYPIDDAIRRRLRRIFR
jgi:hypothetical protein